MATGDISRFPPAEPKRGPGRPPTHGLYARVRPTAGRGHPGASRGREATRLSSGASAFLIRVAFGSFTHGALADLSVDDLSRMLELEETLFVEHKTDIGKETAHGLTSAVASFANTVGGWLLVGVTNGRPNGNAARWEDDSSPTLVDAVRDRLRGEIDPLPAFEAKVISHHEGPVGVVRVYESADTPHVALSSGAVFVREPAGKSDVSDPKRPGGGARGDRAYRAARIRSRAQLVELAARGREAAERVDHLLDPLRPLPLIGNQLGLQFERAGENVIQPLLRDQGFAFVRLVPYTLAPRFRGWSTTADAASALFAAAEELSDIHGLAPSRAIPDPAGVSTQMGPHQDPRRRHHDGAGLPLEITVRLVIDSAGLVGVAHGFGSPPNNDMPRWVRLDELARDYMFPAIKAAAELLTAGEFLGRARCQVDLVSLGSAVLIEEQGNHPGRAWVPATADLALPAEGPELQAVALRAAYAYGRGVGVRAYDPPAGS